MNSRHIALLFLTLVATSNSNATPESDAEFQQFLGRAKIIRATIVCGDEKRDDEEGPRDDADLKTVMAGADSGVPSCQVLLGRWYESGKGVGQDFEAARKLYQSASEKTPSALVALGQMAELGHGQSVSFSEANELYTKASISNHPQSFVALGRMHENARGFPRDMRKAAEFYRKAAARFNNEAWKQLDRLQSSKAVLTADEIAADRLAWLRQLVVRSRLHIEKSRELRKFSGEQKTVVTYMFQRNNSTPNVVVKETSGNEEFDKVLLSVLSKVQMPTPPIYNKSDSSYAVSLPVHYINDDKQTSLPK